MLKSTVRGMVIHNGKLLCVKLKGENFWCLPGGKVEQGEPLLDAFVREMVEETGVNPETDNLLYVHQFIASDEKEFVEFFFSVKNSEAYQDIDLTKTTHGELELDEIAFIDPRNEDVLPRFLSTEADDYLTQVFEKTHFRIEA